MTVTAGSQRGKTSTNLGAARAAKMDEFYTQLTDVEKELRHYKQHFRGKVVYCNADDPRLSAFFRYFSLNFESLGLKKLITTCYQSQAPDLFSQNDSASAVYLEYEGDKNGNRVPDPNEIEVLPLKGDGDFRSPECIELLKQADIVVTNPPFSLFREYVSQLIEHDKKFVIIGNPNATSTKEIFPLVRDEKMWWGAKSSGGQNQFFETTDEFAQRVSSTKPEGAWWRKRPSDGKTLVGIKTVWYTNLDFPKRHEDLILYRKYDPADYPTYDNFDAIEVGRVADIPVDYDGNMGVPLTFLDNWNPEQFEIVAITKTWYGAATKIYPKQIQVSKNGAVSEVTKLNDGAVLKVDTPPSGKTYYKVGDECFIQTYPRILIRRKK